MAPQTPTTFHPFSFLPTELRLEIWRHASTPPPPSTHHRAICILPEAYDAPRLVFSTGNPAMLSTSREARAVALQTAITRPYDPETDLLYMPASRFESPGNEMMSTLAGSGHAWDWVHEVRHVGFAPPSTEVLHLFGQGIPKFRALETVVMVYLGMPGTVVPDEGDGREILSRCWGASARLVHGFEAGDTERRREKARQLAEQWDSEQGERDKYSGSSCEPWLGGLEGSCWFWPEVEPTDDEEERRQRIRAQLEDLEYAVNKNFLDGPYWRTRQWCSERGWLEFRYETRCLAL
ncbi:hypothetical protein QBC34DRAFT_439182 [Podospora aff. communis PSN243]|uniref:2EXR domain-containing protein n=1 Tax=Podospora aff. communis PSN243 TaxID=3040156 RepID=A0AAV9GI51_9PEZI|nr:hypothetical protein QBC34DRAFT_439182 [Podospora aff. communis PSN243]